MSSVLVLAVLVGLWGLVLVPAFRQRHDRLDELRSVDRFSSALRVLSRRGTGAGGTVDRRWVVMPARAASVRAARPAPRVVTPAVRRRRALAVLGGLVVVSLALVLLRGAAWIALQLLADAALAAVLVWCVRSAARERERRARTALRARAAARADARTAVEGAPAWSPAVLARAERSARAGRREVPVRTVPLEGAVPAARTASAAAGGAAAAAAPAATGESRVLTPERGAAAMAARFAPAEDPVLAEPFVAEPASGVRLIDLTTPGVWQRQRLFADRADHLGAGELDDSDAALEALLERRTAAGGW